LTSNNTEGIPDAEAEVKDEVGVLDIAVSVSGDVPD